MILNIYKSKGITSFGVVRHIRKTFGIKKVGHAGTLDPLAEGVLVVVTEADTKKQDQILHSTKEYVAEVGFGVFSESFDLEKLPEEKDVPSLDEVKARLPEIISDFVGEIDQQVPLYSAVKVGGTALYKKARKGKTVFLSSLPVKKVTIHKLQIISTYSNEIMTASGKVSIPVVKLLVECSHGTYIRSLAVDIADRLGYAGILVSLIRTRVGEFKIEDSINLGELKL